MQKIFSLLLLAFLCQFPFNLQSQNQIITTIAGTGVAGYSGDGGAATSAKLNQPTKPAVDAAGNTYVVDNANNVIRKINSSGIITTIVGTGVAGYSGDGGLATNARINYPWGIALDASGNLYIAEGFNNVIRKVDAFTNIITTIAGGGPSESGYSGDGGPATAAKLNFCTSIAVDASGNIYFTDDGNNVIRKIDTGGIISTIAGNGTAGYSGDGGPAASAVLSFPTGLNVDITGNLYLADYTNHVIRKIDVFGIINTIAGNGTVGFSGDGGLATSAQLNTPYDAIADTAGNIFITDAFNNRIRIIDNSGVISTYAGTGVAGYNGDGGLATSAQLNKPIGICLDGNGNLVIADWNNNVVRKVAPASGNGNNCSSSIYFPATNGTSCMNNQTAQTNEIWYQFKAVNSQMHFIIKNDITYKKRITNATVYKGTCAGLISQTDVVANYADTMLVVSMDSLLTGQFYYLALDKNTQCGNCPNAGSKFSLCQVPNVLNLPTPGGCLTPNFVHPITVQDSSWRGAQALSAATCNDLYQYIAPNTTLTFNVNFHFFRPSTASPDYYQNVTAADCDTLIKLVNQRMANFNPPDLLATPPVVNNYSDSHVRYNLVKDTFIIFGNPIIIPHVFFHTNDSAWTDPWGFSGSPHNSYAVNPNSEINIYYTADPLRPTVGLGQYGFVVMSAFPWNPTGWAGIYQTDVGTLVHELGHTAGLLQHSDVTSWGINIPSNSFYPTGGTIDYYDEPSTGPCFIGPSVSQGGCASNNIMGYNSDRTYLSPNQIGSFFYSAYAGINTKFTNSTLPTNRCVYDSSQTINITNDTTWERVVVTNGDIIIQPGKTLYVNCVVALSSGSRIIVMPKGTLYLDGGSLFSRCGTFWPGVQVWGDKNLSQQTQPSGNKTPYFQGLVVLANGASIQGAQVGITTIAKFNNGNQDWNKTGGMIWANNSNFLGNIKDVEFLYYQTAKSRSYFNNCSFNGSNQPPGGWPDARVSLYGIKGVQFKGCYFKAGPLNGNGITSLDAGFTVDKYLTSIISEFRNFNYGIYGQNVTLFDPITVNEAFFNVNFKGGIYLSQGHFATITTNTLYVRYAGSTAGAPDYGIYMDNSHGYSIGKNRFLGPNFANAGTHAGIYINNSGTGANSVYNNYFTKLNYGLFAQEQNQGGMFPGQTGLIMNCHEFVNCNYNIGVTGNQGNVGVMKVQGSFSNPSLYVRNRYNVPSCGTQNIYSIGGQGYQLWHPSFTGALYQPTPQQFCSDSNLIRVYQLTGVFNAIQDCPDNCTGCRTMNEVQQSINRKKVALKSLQNTNEVEKKKQLQHEIDYENNELGLLSNERIREFLNDTLSNDPMDSVIVELKRKRNVNYKRLLAIAYLQKGDYVHAANYRDSVMSDEPTNIDYYDIQTELISMRSDPGGFIAGLKNNIALKNKLLNMANDRASDGCVQAQALLNLAYGLKFQEPILLPQGINQNRFDNSLKNSSVELVIYPNPAGNSINFMYELATDENAQINLSDVSGRGIKIIDLKGGSDLHVLDVSTLNNGVYFVSLLKEGRTIANSKIIIIK